MTQTNNAATPQGSGADPRIICALDLPTTTEAAALVAQIGDAVDFYKIGLQLFAVAAHAELAHADQMQGRRLCRSVRVDHASPAL